MTYKFGKMIWMKKWLGVIAIVICMLNDGLAQGVGHVVLITIDGFRPDFYLDPSWGAVNLRQLMESGASAKGVTGIFPTVTFPSHTTLVTGVKPIVHGIYYNTPFEPAGSTGAWYWHYEAIKSPTLWKVFRQQGLSTASVLWPVTAGAPIDYNVADIWDAGNSDRREPTRRYCTPKGLWEELEQNATGRMDANDFNLDKDYLSMDENIARMAGYIIRRYKPSFTAVHLPAVDHAEHADGRDGEQVRRAIAGADRSVRTIIEGIDKAGLRDSTVVIITGDHGFADRSQNFYPNVLLSKAGLIEDIASKKWQAQFHTAGGSAFLYLKDKADKKTLALVKKILNDLPNEQKKLFRLIEGKKLANAGADPEVILALSAVPGTAFSGSSEGELIRESHGGTHGHFPDFPGIQTGFIVSGPGVKKGVRIESMEMVDIAPLIAKLLGVEFRTGNERLHENMMLK